MGRAKLKMESVRDEKKRNMAFRNKKAGLIKKMHELTVLCDAKACMVIYYGPDKEPLIWPQNQNEVRELVESYKNKEKSGRHKTYVLADFFKDQKRKVEQDIVKLRKEIAKAKFPTWDESLVNLTEQELRELAEVLGNKAALVKSRIGLVKSSAVGSFMGMDLMNYGGPSMDWSLAKCQQGIPFQPNQMIPFQPVPCDYYSIPCVNNGQNGVGFGNQNSMMNLLMNGTNDGDEYGSEFMEPVNFGNSGSVGWFNGQHVMPMPMPLQTYMPQPREQQFPSEENYFGRQMSNFQY